jgi:hypothetical protein
VGASATITLRLDAEARTRIALYDAAGRRLETVAEAAYPAGTHRVRWDPGTSARRRTGVLYLVLEREGRPVSRRAVVLR